MIPNIALELSTEQLISALNERLFMECTKIQSATPPVSRVRVATLTAEVDALEKRVKDILHKVICLRNPLQPVNRLPPELIALCATFTSCIDPRPIITLTHVCRYWREAVTSSHKNWAGIGSGWRNLTPLCLERSGMVPLTVDIRISDEKDWDTLEALLPHVSRISDLSLTGRSPAEDMAKRLPGFFSSNLTSLTLKKTSWSAIGILRSNKIPAPPLFQNFSNLKSLHLTRVPLYPALYNIPSLVKLQLISYAIPFGSFIRFLESNSALEIVTLSLEFVKGSVSTVPERVVALPQLRHLAFTCDNAIDARGLLSWLSLPRSIKIEVHGSHHDPCFDSTSYLPSPPTHIQDLLTPITTVKYRDSERVLHLSNNHSSLYLSARGDSSKLYGELDLFATRTVREFHLLPPQHHYCGIPDHLPEALERLPALEALVISGTSIYPGALSALSREPILCRSLKTIALFDCEVTQRMITELEKMVAERQGRSVAARLHRVVIVNDSRELPNLKLVKQLQGFITCVDVGVGKELPQLL